ncbi:purine-binding chemotaxis protein CheW [Clostridium botulinum]|uniref:chemotaxis protein CheW n=1 Tax=unclassified Clostridium TaxID=2614128 RepID=UPI0013CA6CF2|nr:MULTISPECIES: chemotaxis protein CheW [unclassified Clostridium]MBY7006345.1 purine-binding chemotaxis protein CheW [Clostridium botulinum]NFH71049.1 purine-binding chemotaxis protein CheW [Clostridium botulinum]NFH99959.1 purine-binding chemotaxis protein CheW [Clostridium botulinum]NFI61706.1 purine-binding chemotaxis protein CheW [Clostridium botulinum]NFI79352.1 purine-binding chemotaxis protein CheW [Clostridium botulinum]
MLMNEMKILIFGLNNEYYASDIKDIERILGYEEPTTLPDSPNFVKGVINYQESILPIISLSTKFNLGNDEQSEEKKIIVVKKGNKKFGIIVENVYEVKDIDSKLIEVSPEITTTLSRSYINGLIRLEKKIVILLDVDKILSIEEEQRMF